MENTTLGPWSLYKPKTFPWAWIPAFTPEECKKIVEYGSSLDKFYGTAGDIVDLKYRKSEIAFLPICEESEWIFKKCTDLILTLNQNYFSLDLTHIELLQFTKYDSSGEHYSKHTDMSYEKIPQRKLSFSIQLSEPTDYVGGDLIIYLNSHGTVLNRDQGIMSAFHSYTLHEVVPVTSGVRYSLVGWVLGPNYK